MKARISELLDGELDGREAAGPLDALCGEGEARDTWRRYHLISDAMRDTQLLSAGFAARVAAKIAEDIAKAMDCPIGTVRSRIFRAREAIAEQLRPLLGTSKDKRW